MISRLAARMKACRAIVARRRTQQEGSMAAPDPATTGLSTETRTVPEWHCSICHSERGACCYRCAPRS